MVRLRPVPPLDPPFDDESMSAPWTAAVSGQLALDLSGVSRPGRPPGAQTRHPGGPVPRFAVIGPRGAGNPGSSWPGIPVGSDGPGDPTPAEAVPGPLPPGALVSASPEAKQVARRFLTTCLEIFNGYRPLAHIRPVSGQTEAVTIVRQLSEALDRLVGPPPRPRRPPRMLRARRIRVCEPRVGVAEAAAVLDAPDRAWALPFRLERRQGSWIATSVELL